MPSALYTMTRCMEQIRLLLQNQPPGLQTLNHTNYAAVRFQPIAISIETMTRNAPEEEARVQLGMWVAAHFNSIRMLSHKNLVPLTLHSCMCPALSSFCSLPAIAVNVL